MHDHQQRPAGTLQIVKKVINDNGGTKTVSDFGLATTAGTLVFDAGAAVGSTKTYTATALTVDAGSYTLRENDVAGYTEGTWSCTGATATATAFTAGAVTVPNGGTVVCTITNNDQPGTLQIVKKVTNDNGGTKTVGDFGLATTAGTLVFDAGAAVGSTKTYTATALTVDAGSYTLRENDVAGYTEGTWSCTGATATATPSPPAAVTVPNGGTVVCTITNNDQPGTLQIVKKVTNDNGGTKTVGDFGLATTAGTLVFDAGAAVGSTKTYTATALTVDAGSYTFGRTTSPATPRAPGAAPGRPRPRPPSPPARSPCPTAAPSSARSPTTTSRAPCRSSRRSPTTTAGPRPSATSASPPRPGPWSFEAAVETGSTKTYTAAALTVNAGSYTFHENDVAGYAEGTWAAPVRPRPRPPSGPARSPCPTAGPSCARSPTTTSREPADRQERGQRQRWDHGRRRLRPQHLRRDPGLRGRRRAGLEQDLYGGRPDRQRGQLHLPRERHRRLRRGHLVLRRRDRDRDRLQGRLGHRAQRRDRRVHDHQQRPAGSLQSSRTWPTTTVGPRPSATSASTLRPGRSSSTPASRPRSTKTYTAAALTVNAGSYTFHENDVAGYAEGTWCCTGAPHRDRLQGRLGHRAQRRDRRVQDHQQRPAGSLQIVKNVANDNGGATAVGAGLNTSAGTARLRRRRRGRDRPRPTRRPPLTVNAGSYTFHENDIAGYAEGTWSCTGAPHRTPPGPARSPCPTAGPSCAHHQQRPAGSLQIVKNVANDNGGTTAVGDFGLNHTAGTLVFGAGARPTRPNVHHRGSP